MNGGKETPCVPDHYLKKYEADFCRPCPRIALHTINEDASTMTLCALGEHTKAILPALILSLDRDGDDLIESMRRSIFALNSKKFNDALERHRKKHSG